MSWKDKLNINNYKKLSIFLKENDLEINIRYCGDMDYDYYEIVKKGDNKLFKNKYKQTDWHISFFFGQECKEFTWDFKYKVEDIESMDEDMFLYKLNKIKNKWCKNWNGKIDINDLNRM